MRLAAEFRTAPSARFNGIVFGEADPPERDGVGAHRAPLQQRQNVTLELENLPATFWSAALLRRFCFFALRPNHLRDAIQYAGELFLAK